MSSTPPPPGPAPSGPPSAAPRDGGGRRGLLVGGAVALLLVVVVVLVLALSGDDDPTSVQDVADQAVDAAQGLDVEKGLDLLCSTPSADDRDELEQLISDGQEAAGTDDPYVAYDVSDVEGEETGSFVVTITSDESGLSALEVTFDVTVGRDGDRSCIEDYQGED